MCRSSSKSFGFLLLLWIGIFLPVAEYQASHVADGLGIGGVLHAPSDEGDDHTDAFAKDADDSDGFSSIASADLSDFTLTPNAPQLTLIVQRLSTRRPREAFSSHVLPPQERPPIARAA